MLGKCSWWALGLPWQRLRLRLLRGHNKWPMMRSWGSIWRVLGGRHRVLRIVGRSAMHLMHVGLLIAIPVRRVLLMIWRQHGGHGLLVVWLILMWPHGRRHGWVRAIMPPLRSLHGHGVLPIWVMILLHGWDEVAFRAFFARTWCHRLGRGASLSFLIFGLLNRGQMGTHGEEKID